MPIVAATVIPAVIITTPNKSNMNCQVLNLILLLEDDSFYDWSLNYFVFPQDYDS